MPSLEVHGLPALPAQGISATTLTAIQGSPSSQGQGGTGAERQNSDGEELSLQDSHQAPRSLRAHHKDDHHMQTPGHHILLLSFMLFLSVWPLPLSLSSSGMGGLRERRVDGGGGGCRAGTPTSGLPGDSLSCFELEFYRLGQGTLVI